MPLNMKNINNLPCEKYGSVDLTFTCDHAPKAPRAVWAQYTEYSGHFQYTAYLQKSQSENRKLINFV